MSKRTSSEDGQYKLRKETTESIIICYSSEREDPKVNGIADQGYSSTVRVSPSPSKSFQLLCKRFVSLEDLSSNTEKDLEQRRHLALRSVDKMKKPRDEVKEEHYYQLKGYVGFLKNAWRRSKQEANRNKAEIISFSNKASNLSMQVSALKCILSNDEKLVASWAKEIHRLKSEMSKLLEVVTFLRQEGRRLESVAEGKEEEGERLKTELMNERNACEAARSEAAALEAQLAREREKIVKLKLEIQSLVAQLNNFCKENDEKEERLQKVISTVEELGEKIVSLEELLKDADLKLVEDARALQTTTEVMKKLKVELSTQYKLNTKLQTNITGLEEDLKKKDIHYEALEKYWMDFMLNTVEAQAKQTGALRFKNGNWKGLLEALTFSKYNVLL